MRHKGERPRIYFDNCCYSRLSDRLANERVRNERLLLQVVLNDHQIRKRYALCASEILAIESARNPNDAGRKQTSSYMTQADVFCEWDAQIDLRGAQLERLGFFAMDALHIACAEQMKCDMLVTVDDRMRKLAWRRRSQLQVRVVGLDSLWAELMQ